MNGVGAFWWPTPVRPSTWFDDDELTRSRAYHRPLAAVGMARLALRFLLIAFSHVLVVRLGWPKAGPAAIAMVAVAWWLPGAASDWWFEFRHEPRFGSQSMPLRRFAAGSLTALVFCLVGVGLSALLMQVAWAISPQWWWLFAAATVPAIVYVLGWLEPRFTAAAHRTSPLVDGAFDALAKRAGVSDVGFHRMDSDALVGLNALTSTGRGQPRIVISSELLDADRRLTEHVVAHELSHLRHRHPARTKLVTAAGGVGVVAAAGALASWNAIETNAGLANIGGIENGQPPTLGLMAVLLLTLGGVAAVPLAFVSRAQERQADAGAFALVGPVPVPLLRQLHVTDRALLDPGLIERIALPHPSAAERLHRGSTVTNGGLPSGA